MIEDFLFIIKSRLGFGPKSKNWKHWVAQLDLKTCSECRTMHGKIYAAAQKPEIAPPLHMYCRCLIRPMNAINAFESKNQGANGAPYWLKSLGCLPKQYITGEQLQILGWKWGKSPSKYAPGMIPTMGIYRNDNEHLPIAPERVWYEADINYTSGKRNAHRVVWSNDGLVFVTYDHYVTFVEVI